MGRGLYKQCGQQFALNVAYKVLYNAAYPTRVVQRPIWIVQRGFWRQQPAQYLYLVSQAALINKYHILNNLYQC